MKKICIIFCGGTITMKRNMKGVLTPFYGAPDIIKLIPQVALLADITVIRLTNVDSSNLDPLFWATLVRTIEEKKDQFDGFVITHGTDTMAYTASAISFALSHLRKPIVFTGAQKPAEDVPSDAASNLINAVLVAANKPVGVCIVFGSKILQGNRATKISESSLDAFDSPMFDPIGRISLEPEIFHATDTGKGQHASVHASFDPNVIVIQVVPGLPEKYLQALLDSDIHGIIFEGFGPGNMPKALLPVLGRAEEMKIPVVILSQCRKGITRMQLYEVGQQALDAGVIPGGDMTVEAAATKLMWLLDQTKNYTTLKRLYPKNVAGEVTIHD